MRRKALVLLFILAPVLLGTLAVVAVSQEVPSTGELAFNQPSGAMPRVGDPSNPSTGGFSSKNVEYEGFFFANDEPLGQPVPGNPEILSATGANIRGDYMYLTSWKNISNYDISDPLNTRL